MCTQGGSWRRCWMSLCYRHVILSLWPGTVRICYPSAPLWRWFSSFRLVLGPVGPWTMLAENKSNSGRHWQASWAVAKKFGWQPSMVWIKLAGGRYSKHLLERHSGNCLPGADVQSKGQRNARGVPRKLRMRSLQNSWPSALFPRLRFCSRRCNQRPTGELAPDISELFWPDVWPIFRCVLEQRCWPPEYSVQFYRNRAKHCAGRPG